MAQLSYRDAGDAGIAQELRRDERVVLFGEDTAAAGGVFKTTVGLLEEFGPRRVKDTPISELAILGAAMGAAMTGLRPVAEIMFSDFLACCWDYVANEIAKTRYMSDGQITIPLVIRTANGAGSRFGAQHSQSVENWAMAVPGLKVVAPSNPADAKGLLAAAIRDPDPVVFFEHKSLLANKGEVPEGEHLEPLGRAKLLPERRRNGRDHAAAGRNGDRGNGGELVQEGGRRRARRRAALRGRNRQGDDRDSGGRERRAQGDPGRGRQHGAGGHGARGDRARTQ